jgi:shikimate dehydrogenase
MASSNDIAAIQTHLTNRLDDSVIGDKAIAGVIGEAPSHYSKSPRLWEAAFRQLAINATYLPFDVVDARIGELLAALRDSERVMGVNVTVPHKVRVMDFLDDLDPGARRIQAVNTIVRTRSGRLIGYNTDGEGFVQSILTVQPGRKASFIPSLKGINVLLLGAGGSARAVALHVSELLDGGQLVICNRTIEHATSLAAEVQKAGGRALAVSENELPSRAPTAGLIINSTTKGQGGVRKLPNGRTITLEAYSALASAHSPALAQTVGDETDFRSKWRAAAAQDIDVNNKASLALAQSIPSETRFYDLIYYPEETIFLRHGQMTGHLTMNGQAMIINQAVIAFCQRICSAELQARGIGTPATFKRILEVMYGAW